MQEVVIYSDLLRGKVSFRKVMLNLFSNKSHTDLHIFIVGQSYIEILNWTIFFSIVKKELKFVISVFQK